MIVKKLLSLNLLILSSLFFFVSPSLAQNIDTNFIFVPAPVPEYQDSTYQEKNLEIDTIAIKEKPQDLIEMKQELEKELEWKQKQLNELMATDMPTDYEQRKIKKLEQEIRVLRLQIEELQRQIESLQK